MKKIKLFCGGKFHFDYLNTNYINDAKNDYRSIILRDVNLLLNKQNFVSISPKIDYIGPFYFESDGMIDKDIIENEIKMINEATHIFILLEDGLAPGSISELIYASSLNKYIDIFYIKYDENEETESNLHSPCWYPIIMSQLVNNKNTNIIKCDSYKDAVDKIIIKLNELAF